MLETREGIRDSRSLNVAIRGGQGVDDVEIDVVGGAVVGVVDNNIHDFGSRIGDIVKVDGDIVAGPACAFGGPTQLPDYRVQGIMSVGAKTRCPGAAVVVEVVYGCFFVIEAQGGTWFRTPCHCPNSQRSRHTAKAALTNSLERPRLDQ